MAKGGAKTWYFPDGYLPEKVKNGTLDAHEALMIFNAGRRAAKVKLDFYFEEQPPVKDVAVAVGAERVRCLRLDHPETFGGPSIGPMVQYALRVRSNVPIVVQFGRLDTTQNAMAYYMGIGYAE